jgi:3-methyladenine DNA glycosylase AlkC
MIFQDYVEVYGLNYFQKSMEALAHFSINSSSEFAIRRFIIKYPNETMIQMKKWAFSENEHLRRLASEGCRPRLPWAIALKKFKKDPSDVLEILEILKDDNSRYVQKSVANSINDISKENPNIVKKLIKNWLGENKNRDWICKHGSRTLLKNSDKDILKLFGFSNATHIKLSEFKISEKVNMGEELIFSFRLNSSESLGKLRIEFVIDFLRQNAKYNRKVFKLAESDYKENSKKISKKYSFKTRSTRIYYRGIQKLSVVINGEEFIKKEFTLF